MNNKINATRQNRLRQSKVEDSNVGGLGGRANRKWETENACKESMQAAGGMQVLKSTAVYFKM